MSTTVGGISADASPGTPPAAHGGEQPIPWLGLVAVLLGACISTFTTRISVFGINDIRGAVHAGFDEGAWITTAQGAAQMMIAPVAVWLGSIFGARRVLIEAAVAFALISFIEPFSTNLPTLLGLQFLGGLASGFFIPLTIGFVLKNMPPRLWAYGIALYALNLEFSLNISASLEGWYVDNWSWRWIFWQYVPLSIGMAVCLRFGARPESASATRPPVDWFGFISGALAVGLIYAALDQGNRLDWANSPLIWGLMLAGLVLLAGFFVHESTTAHPALDLKVLFTAPLPRQMLLISFLRLTILSTSYVIPQFLNVVRGFRAIEVGETLVWIAVPQFVLSFLAGMLLRRIDARIVSSIGFLCVCASCISVAHYLTPLWGTIQFLPSALLQAIGQTFALSGIVFFGILHLRPQDAITFGATLQFARLMGGEIGSAFIATFVRVRGQIASNLLGLHVQVGDRQVLARVHDYAALTAPAGGPASTRGEAVLNSAVHAASITQGIIDSFLVIGTMTALALIVLVTRQAAPLGPASHRPLFFSARPTAAGAAAPSAAKE